jgi:hypothetical protein
MVGLGNVDDTSDEQTSFCTQQTLDLKRQFGLDLKRH